MKAIFIIFFVILLLVTALYLCSKRYETDEEKKDKTVLKKLIASWVLYISITTLWYLI